MGTKKVENTVEETVNEEVKDTNETVVEETTVPEAETEEKAKAEEEANVKAENEEKVKLKVLANFTDKYTKKAYKANDVITVEKARADELLADTRKLVEKK